MILFFFEKENHGENVHLLNNIYLKTMRLWKVYNHVEQVLFIDYVYRRRD